jgi:hypothetical protein
MTKEDERPVSESEKTFEEYCRELKNNPRCDYDEGDDGEVVTFVGGFRPEFVNRAAEHLRKQGRSSRLRAGEPMAVRLLALATVHATATVLGWPRLLLPTAANSAGSAGCATTVDGGSGTVDRAEAAAEARRPRARLSCPCQNASRLPSALPAAAADVEDGAAHPVSAPAREIEAGMGDGLGTAEAKRIGRGLARPTAISRARTAASCSLMSNRAFRVKFIQVHRRKPTVESL